jgi:hypothetical protein
MHRLSKIVLLITSLTFVGYSEIDQYISITGGTNGLGAKYSIFYKRISVSAGIPIMFKYYKSNFNDGYDYIESNFIADQYFMLTGCIVKKKNYLLNIGLSEINKFGYGSFAYQNDSLNTNSNKPALSLTNSIGPVIEFYGIKDDERRYSVQIVPMCFYLRGGEIYWHTVLQLNYFLKKIR